MLSLSPVLNVWRDTLASLPLIRYWSHRGTPLWPYPTSLLPKGLFLPTTSHWREDANKKRSFWGNMVLVLTHSTSPKVKNPFACNSEFQYANFLESLEMLWLMCLFYQGAYKHYTIFMVNILSEMYINKKNSYRTLINKLKICKR